MVDISKIQVKGPEQVGPANVYLLENEGEAVLIDVGPGEEETFQDIEEGLAKEGLEPEDLDKILITHPHSDHFGNASRLKELSGAKVMIHREAVPIVENYEEYVEDQNDRFEQFFRRTGVPEEENSDLTKKCIPNSIGVSVEVDRPLEDGDKVSIGDRELEVVYSPGHCPGPVAFVLEDKAFVGDTVLDGITPNPMLYLPEGEEDPAPSLEHYLQTLKGLKSRNLSVGYPGHGKNIEDLGSRINEILEHHEERKENVYNLVKTEKTAFEVMMDMFPGLPVEKYIFGMSEAYGHLELLVKEGRLEKAGNEPFKYRRP